MLDCKPACLMNIGLHNWSGGIEDSYLKQNHISKQCGSFEIENNANSYLELEISDSEMRTLVLLPVI